MEHVGAISEGKWNSMCWEEEDFMAQLLGDCSLPDEVEDDTNFPVSSTFWPVDRNIAGVDESGMYFSDETNTSLYSVSQGSSYSGGNGILFPITSHEISYYPTVSHQVFVTHNNLTTMDYCMMEDKNNSWQVSRNEMGGDDFLNQDVGNDSIESSNNLSEDVLQGKNLEFGRVLAMPLPEVPKDDKLSSPAESKKRSRIHGDVQRNRRSIKLNKCPKVDGSHEDNNNNNNNNAALHRQSSSSCCSEDDSHELNGVASSSSSKGSRALDLNAKTRATLGSASDPQSLYARKRRERINERLRILQNLVPNGTKVDISTMLEEAVQYVKFLQPQFKLLSSDDLWMYAPIAYNGMDIGLDLKISTPIQNHNPHQESR